MMLVKEVPVDKLMIGMYVVGLDTEWPTEGRYANTHLIQSSEHIEFFITKGASYAMIDPSLGKDVEISQSADGADPLSKELSIARIVRDEAITVLQGVYEGVKSGAPINDVAVKETVSSLLESVISKYDVLLSLIHMQRNDANMFSHAVNVCAFSLVLGKNEGYAHVQLEQLGVGALLHDIGELRLPDNLLRKREVFSGQERRLLQQHPDLGVKILSAAGGIHRESQRIVREHHERIDGSGYPAGISGNDISPLSEIVALVDTYDAMLSSREGRPPLQPAQAIRELYRKSLKGCIARHWVERIIRCLGIYPVGSFVELNSGEIAMVVAANPNDALRPKIRVIDESIKSDGSSMRDVDLSTVAASGAQISIVRALELDELTVDVATFLKKNFETL